ncbi:MAG: serine/threonine-protein kinase [Bryobacteraceae bacterium]
MNPGDRYGRYQITRLIGRGAMGEVFLATDTEMRRQIALKLVYKGPDAEDQEVIEAERLGAELQKRLSGFDRRVVVVNRYGEINGDLFIEMEYIEGEDLSTILSRGPLSPGFATHIAVELCEMLENLSAFTTTIADRQFAGIIHGDLKPRNVRLNTHNQVKALDFGIAKALSSTRKATVNLFASTAYCSPERLETQQMDSHSDLWSVGVLLYQMLSARLPFDEPNKERLERRIRSSAPPAPLGPGCPEPLNRIIFQMLSRDPAARYQSATAMKADLVRFRNNDSVLATPPQFDSDATVRTDGTMRTDATMRTTTPGPLPLRADDSTTRTMAGSVKPPPPPVIPPIIWPPRNPQRNRTLGCLAALGFAGFLALLSGLMQLSSWRQAEKLKSDLQTERVTNLDDAWSRYQALAKRTGVAISGARGALKDKLIASADEVILDYRNNDAPALNEAQWVKARNNLAHAMELDPSDNAVKGRLREVEGHLDQIYGDRSRNATRQKYWNASLAKFNEASELLQKSPDPYLGLARLYGYDLNDMDRAEDALNKAGEFGHPEGKKEIALLADGYRKRADRFWKESRSLIENPDQERDYLSKARQDYIHAQTLYEKLGLFGDAARNQLLASQSQQHVDDRLAQLQYGTVPK